MAQIRKRGNTYTISVYAGTDQNGRRIMKHATFAPSETTPKKIEKEVAAFAAEFENRIKNGLYFDGEKIKFGEFVEKWKENYAKANLTPRVYQDYEYMIRTKLMPTLGNMIINKIKAVHLQAIYSEMLDAGRAPATVKKVHAVASSIFTHAYKWNIIEENICRRVELPKTSSYRDVSCFNTEQASRFLNAISKPLPVKISGHDRIDQNGNPYHVDDYIEYKEVHLQFQVFFNLALFGGFRRGELIALTWNDIDFENNCVNVTKSTSGVKGGQIDKPPKTRASIRSVTLPSNCMQLLRKWRIKQREYSISIGSVWEGRMGRHFDDNYIFITDTGRQMDLATPYHKFKRIIRLYNESCGNEADMLPDIRLHDLRHTSATLLISQNVDIKTVSSRLGHSKTSVTLDIYTHALKQLDEKASDALDGLLNKHA